MRSDMESSLSLVNAFLQEMCVRSGGVGSFGFGVFCLCLSSGIIVSGTTVKKSLHGGLLLPWRRLYWHLLKTQGHRFLQYGEG